MAGAIYIEKEDSGGFSHLTPTLLMNLLLQMNLLTPHPALSPLRGEGNQGALRFFREYAGRTSFR